MHKGGDIGGLYPRGVPAPVASGAQSRGGRTRDVGSGVFDSPGHLPQLCGAGLQPTTVFPLFVFYLSEFCSCLGRLMQIDNGFIRKRPSRFYPVIGGNQEDA